MDKDIAQQSSAVFVHSLFRSGSTFIYDTLKRAGHKVYHEPNHEVIALLPREWSELDGNREKTKEKLRHHFLRGGYFDEYVPLLPAIQKTFDVDFSYGLYFLDEADERPKYVDYLSVLMDAGGLLPVLQCTRTTGRIRWYRANYKAKHVFLLRNPWDQWYSYKVDEYIAATPQLVLGQQNLPPALSNVVQWRQWKAPAEGDLSQRLTGIYENPVTPETDYALFFALWLHAYMAGHADCDLVVDMDEISANKKARDLVVRKFAQLGLKDVGLDTVSLHRAVFLDEEQNFFWHIEEQVLELFRQAGGDGVALQSARSYLKQQRAQSFLPQNKLKPVQLPVVDDAVRLRRILHAADSRSATARTNLRRSVGDRLWENAQLNKVIAEKEALYAEEASKYQQSEKRIAEFGDVRAQYDARVEELNQALMQYAGQIEAIRQASVDKDTRIDALTMAVEQKEQLTAELNGQLLQYEGRVRRLDQELLEQLQTRADLERTVGERDSRLADLANAMERRDRRAAELNAVVAERDRQIANLNQALAEQAQRNAELESSTAATIQGHARAYEERLGALIGDISAKNVYIAEIKAELLESRDQLSSLQVALERRNNLEEELQAALSQKSKENEESRQELALRSAELIDLQRRLSERDDYAADLQRNLGIREDRIVGLEAELTEREGRIAELESDLVGRDGKIAGFANHLAEVGTEKALLQQVVEALTQQVEVYARQAEGHAQQVQAYDQKITDLERTVSEREQAVDALQAELGSWQELIVRLKDELEQQASQLVGQQFAGAALQHRADSLQNKLDALVMDRIGLAAESEKIIGGLRQSADELQRQRDDLEHEVQRLSSEVHRYTQSNSWRITAPLREMRRWLGIPGRLTRGAARGVLGVAKSAYQRLPLDHSTKVAHRSFLVQVAPKMLLLSGSAPWSVIQQERETLPALTYNPLSVLRDAEIENDQIKLPEVSAPVVSVVIPVYGKIDYTLRCLVSIARHLPTVPFEVIVVDDASPDDSVEQLRGVRNLRLVVNEKNQGFIGSCNAGARAARGSYLHFLNNDTEVQLGWLDELYQTFANLPGTGLVGSKLVYPNGSLQEAGGIIWQNGSGWNFGRGGDPLLPVYNYAREVDYCSGASIMVPKELFFQFGGFDDHYKPAYCEDADLALRLRDNGYRVIYQPMSVVVHYEGITSGTDLSQGVKAYQVENTRKLFDRWRHRLQSHQANGLDVYIAKDRVAKRRVLVLDHCTPTPDQDAGSVTAFNMLLLLRDMGFQVTFVAEDNFLYMPDYTTALQRLGIEVLYAPFVRSVREHLSEYGQYYDLVMPFRPVVAERHLRTIREFCPAAKVLYVTVDLHFLRMQREAELQQDAVKMGAAAKMKLLELATIKDSDASIVHSAAEMELLDREKGVHDLHFYPLILDIPGTEVPFEKRRDILFVGGYQHTPNIDAVKFFVAEVMPVLRRKLPDVRFLVVGSKPPPEILALAADDIHVLGFVEDLKPLLDSVRVSVAPLRYGAGIKGKVGVALAAGLPVVATTVAAEGMELASGEDVLLADDAEGFASAIAMLYQNPEKWQSLSRNGVKVAERLWGGEAAWQRLRGILSTLGFIIEDHPHPLRLYK